ncbi:MAG TPA: FMN-binding protein [Gammaproteobacteria bacterium]|nr:FMN-binding protein [Candidatus Hydrogenedentota bacterium]HJP35622.1 FMN-binding protein [Gammaproteobacteria bacterium]
MNLAEQVEHTAPPVESFKLIRTLALVAMFSGFLIVLVVQATEPRIAENKQRALERAVFEVLPGATTSVTFSVLPEGLKRMAADGNRFGGPKAYAGYNEDGTLAGVALEAEGQGYQHIIRILYGYSPDQQILTGMTVLESKETPGLGDKIAKSPEFLANFAALDVRVDPGGQSLLHAIETVKHGAKTDTWQIDGITGATISSVAIGKMLGASAQAMVPFINEHRAELELEGSGK